MAKIWVTFMCFLIVTSLSNAQSLAYMENKGQWHENVHFRAELPSSFVYLDQEGISINLYEPDFYSKLHDWHGGKDTVSIGNGHAIKFRFDGADLSNRRGEEVLYANTNFFLGDDPNKWASKVKSFERIYYDQVYEGIDLRFASGNGHMKYDFIVAPEANPDQIRIQIDGADRLGIKDGNLVVETSVGTFEELAPFAYQLNSLGIISPVACKYKLENSTLTYVFPEGYDESRELIIDPELSFSSFIGSSASNFGTTASYDEEGNLYAGAIVFGALYPTTAGTFQVNFAGGTIDCGLSKFSPDGTDLIYNTYLGGDGSETPHSIVVNDQNELYILGTTSSIDFPDTWNAYQGNFAGGQLVGGIGFSYVNGTDIFISKLSATGENLLGSTFLGGSGNDGIGAGTALDFNYGDRFRGEITLDDESNVYIASVTQSNDFPIVNGYANTMSSLLTGVIAKLSSGLDNLIWSTYSGGNGIESAFGLQLAEDNSVYFTGGTMSTSIPSTGGAYQSSIAGNVDGFIGHISSDGSTLLECTYNGTNAFDQNYFVQVGPDGNVFVVGQTEGSYPKDPDVYGTNNAGQYIQKFTPDLSTSLWSTTVGSGNGIDISPSAFLVSDCGQIFLSGWGGDLNTAGGNTFGLPVSADAFQSNTDGEDFYIMVLGADASGLDYATFFGGNSALEHVDGGTSRFDKNGIVYQAVCAGCGGSNDFPTQPGVWSETNPSSNCNLGVIKFDLATTTALAEVEAAGGTICMDNEFELINNSVGADSYLWVLGDGNESTEESLFHTYDEPGEYEIILYAFDATGCLYPDSTILSVTVEPYPDLDVTVPDVGCPGDEVQLSAFGADTYEWFPDDDLNANNISDPIFSGTESVDLFVVGTTTCGVDTVPVPIVIGSNIIEITADTTICPGESVQLNVEGGVTYSWSPAVGLNNPNIANPIATPPQDVTYVVTVTTAEDCEFDAEVEIDFLPPAPTLEGEDRYVSCNGEVIEMEVSGADTYEWSPETGLSSTTSSVVSLIPNHPITYSVVGFNVCGSDTLEILVLRSDIEVGIIADTITCHSDPFYVEAYGASTYAWQPADVVENPYAESSLASIEQSTLIQVSGYDTLGCKDTESIYIFTYPREPFRAGNDRVISFGEFVTIESFSEYNITWEPNPTLSCLNCNYPVASPEESTMYYASIITDEGCTEIDSVHIGVRGDLFVPNAFTPDGDGLNDFFKARGLEIESFKMEIFNRWGDRVFVSEDIENGWNGSYLGGDYYCPPDVYPYRIVAREVYGEVFELTGFVTLIR